MPVLKKRDGMDHAAYCDFVKRSEFLPEKLRLERGTTISFDRWSVRFGSLAF